MYLIRICCPLLTQSTLLYEKVLTNMQRYMVLYKSCCREQHNKKIFKKVYLKRIYSCYNDICHEAQHLNNILFRSSSVVEQSAVNRSVVGSSPTCGAIIASIAQ